MWLEILYRDGSTKHWPNVKKVSSGPQDDVLLITVDDSIIRPFRIPLVNVLSWEVK